MSKRLQVLFSEDELAEIQQIANVQQMTVAEWVRQALRKARQTHPLYDMEKKIHVVREASRHRYPSGSIEQILEEIERGSLDRDEA